MTNPRSLRSGWHCPPGPFGWGRSRGAGLRQLRDERVPGAVRGKVVGARGRVEVGRAAENARGVDIARPVQAIARPLPWPRSADPAKPVAATKLPPESVWTHRRRPRRGTRLAVVGVEVDRPGRTSRSSRRCPRHRSPRPRPSRCRMNRSPWPTTGSGSRCRRGRLGEEDVEPTVVDQLDGVPLFGIEVVVRTPAAPAAGHEHVAIAVQLMSLP